MNKNNYYNQSYHYRVDPSRPILLRNPLKSSTELDTIEAECDKCDREELDGVVEDIDGEIVEQVVETSSAFFSSKFSEVAEGVEGKENSDNASHMGGKV